jgi:hypothetical protein
MTSIGTRASDSRVLRSDVLWRAWVAVRWNALQMLTDECPRGRRWVVETDIASCFPAIPHEQLMEAVEELLRRDRLGGLIREYA